MDAQLEQPAIFKAPSERKMMVQTEAAQREISGNFQIKPLSEILKPLSGDANIDFYNFYKNDYQVKTLDGKIMPVSDHLDAEGDYADLAPFFHFDPDNPNFPQRKFFILIDRFFHKKTEADLKDFLIMEEELPHGKLLVIFDCPPPQNHYRRVGYLGGVEAKIDFLRIRGCYAVNTDQSDRDRHQAVDLTEALLKDRQLTTSTGVPFEVKGIKRIGIARQDEQVTMVDQIENLKQKGLFLFNDSFEENRWLNLFITAASHTQQEADKMGELTDLFKTISEPIAGKFPEIGRLERDSDALGVIRQLLGEMPEGIVGRLMSTPTLLAHLSKYKADNFNKLPPILRETRDWIRNRIAVALSAFFDFHYKFGIDFYPWEKRRELIVAVEKLLGSYSKTEKLFQKLGYPLQSLWYEGASHGMNIKV